MYVSIWGRAGKRGENRCQSCRGGGGDDSTAQSVWRREARRGVGSPPLPAQLSHYYHVISSSVEGFRRNGTCCDEVATAHTGHAPTMTTVFADPRACQKLKSRMKNPSRLLLIKYRTKQNLTLVYSGSVSSSCFSVCGIINVGVLLSSLSTKLVPIAKHDNGDDNGRRLSARYSRLSPHPSASARPLRPSLTRSLRGL